MERLSGIVGHVFGTLKARAGWSHHFLTRGLEKVRGERSLMCLGYNLTRVLNVVGEMHLWLIVPWSVKTREK